MIVSKTIPEKGKGANPLSSTDSEGIRSIRIWAATSKSTCSLV